MASPPQPEHHEDTPFLLRLFYRQGAFHMPEEFAARTLPQCLSLYTQPNSTLHDLALQIAAERPSLLPNPAIGTRIAFRLVFPDARSVHAASSHSYHPIQPRFIARDIGSVVLGEGGPGVANGFGAEDDNDFDNYGGRLSPVGGGPLAGDTTLQSVKFVVGDYVSCAILPPLADGSVAPEVSLRASLRGPPAGRDMRGPRGPGPYPHDNGRRDGGGGGGFGRGGRDRGRGGGFGGFVPEGDWRRGDPLPDEGGDRSWGRSRRRW